MSLLTQIWALAGYILPFLFVLSLVFFSTSSTIS